MVSEPVSEEQVQEVLALMIERQKADLAFRMSLVNSDRVNRRIDQNEEITLAVLRRVHRHSAYRRQEALNQWKDLHQDVMSWVNKDFLAYQAAKDRFEQLMSNSSPNASMSDDAGERNPAS